MRWWLLFRPLQMKTDIRIPRDKPMNLNLPIESLSVIRSQQTRNICIIFIQRRPNVFDVSSTFYKFYTNVLCLLGCDFANIGHYHDFQYVNLIIYNDILYIQQN